MRLPGSNKTMRQLYDATIDRENWLRAQAYDIRVMWECTLNAELKVNTPMKVFFDERKSHHPLNPRESLYGGRVSVLRMLCEPGEHESIHYIDVNS